MPESPNFAKEWSVKGGYGAEKTVIREIAEAIGTIDPENNRLDDILTVVAESCLNAFEHGGRPDAEGDEEVKVSMKADDRSLKFRICDRGPVVPELPVPDIRDNWLAEHPRGWGLLFIRELSDRFEYGQCDGWFYVEATFYR